MISTSNEQLINLRQVPNYLEKKIGKRLHLGTIYRWSLKGISGVRLESMVIGGTRVTSKEALDRFFEKSTQAKDKRNQGGDATKSHLRSLEAQAEKLGI